MKKFVIAVLTLCCSNIVFSLSEDWLATQNPSSPEITYYVNKGKTISVTKFLSETMSLKEVAKSLYSSFTENKANCTDVRNDESYLVFSCENNEKKNLYDVIVGENNGIAYAAILIGGATKEDFEQIIKDTESK